MNDDAKLLVVDDDQMVLDFAVRALTSLGYSTATSTDAASALALLEQDEHIRVLFIDMCLGEGPTGAQLTRQALAIRPNLRVLITSGDPGLLKVAGQELPQHVELLAKPYRRRDLAARLSRLL